VAIRVRTLNDGTKVYDAHMTGAGSPHQPGHSIHLGTFRTIEEAREVEEYWKASGEWDREILRRRQDANISSRTENT
jgi:hypothetical protein